MLRVRKPGSIRRLLAAAAVCHASSAIAQIRFELPEHCGSESELRSELERLVGADTAAAMPTFLAITVEPDGTHVLNVRMGDESRELRHSDCRTLFRSAVVIAAARVRPELAPPAADAPSAPADTPPASPAEPARLPIQNAPAAPAAVVPVAERNDAEWFASAAAGLGLSVGVVPKVGPVLELRLAAGPRPWSLAVAGRYLVEQRATAEGRSAGVSGVEGRLAVGYAPLRMIAVSLGLEGVRLSGEGGSDVSERQADVASDVAPSLEVAVIPYDSEYFQLELALAGRVSLLRPRFVVTGFGDVYRVPAAGGLALLRGAWLFL